MFGQPVLVGRRRWTFQRLRAKDFASLPDSDGSQLRYRVSIDLIMLQLNLTVRVTSQGTLCETLTRLH